MPRLEIFLLGSPRVECDGAPIEVDTRKAIALVAYLAVTGETHGRDTLAALLWPDYDQAGARAALRRTLSTLNKALGGSWLEADRETIRLRRDDGFYLDVEQFRRLLAAPQTHGHGAGAVCPNCLPPLAEAAALYRGDFLAGFSLRDSANFDDWQFLQAENLQRELAGALERLVRCYVQRGEWDQAIAPARRWLALDPLHEPAHRQLMILYARSGQRAAALRQYQECARILEDELGVAPLEETAQLHEAIRKNRLEPLTSVTADGRRPTAAPGLQPSAVGRPPSAAPLVGRSAEWASLVNVYTGLRADGHFLALEGEAGIGKTRLAEEFLAYARSQGAAVIAARCYEGETALAFGPFIEAMRAAAAHPECPARVRGTPLQWVSEAARLLPELTSLIHDLPPAPPLEGPGAQSRFFEGLRRVMLAICAGAAPGVLFLDDLHWADDASLDLLTYLVRRLSGHPLLILVTWRSDRLPADHRLRLLLAQGEREGLSSALTLPRLSFAEVAKLIESTTPADAALSAKLSERLYRETEGLPFFVVEYLMMATVGEQGDWPMPHGVRDLLRARLSAIGETSRQLLQTAAAIGRSFDFGVLRVASGRSEDETVAALESLIAQGLAHEVSGREDPQSIFYDFTHDKLRELVYEETSAARRRLLHGRVAEALVGQSRLRRNVGPMAGQIAFHYRRAGQDALAATYFKAAGDHARSLYANREAVAHLQEALAAGHPQAADLHETIGDLQTLLGEYTAAIASYQTASALCGADCAARLNHKLGSVHHRLGEWELAVRHFEAALETLGETGPAGERAAVYADWSRTAYHQNQTDQAMQLAQRALTLAQTAADPSAEAQAHNILGILARSRGDLDLAREHLKKSLRIAQASGDPAARIAACNNLALAHGDLGELDRAIELTQTALELCIRHGDRHREAALHNHLADLFHAAGRSETAMIHLKKAVVIFAEIGVEAGSMKPEIWKLTEW